MQLELPRVGLEGYKSNSQRARIATEAWATKNLYCLNCASDELSCSPPNTAAVDYVCPNCDASFQLKAQSHSFGSKILDAAYATMLQKIREDETPNLVALHYERDLWRVRNIFFVPHFAFSISAIEKRPPLAPTARRAGWVGCNILLEKIPSDARIPLVVDGKPANPSLARKQYAKVRPLSKLRPEMRGWTLDVLNLLRSLGKQTFTLADAYTLEPHLASLHPANRHVRDKIRQQLQILRDLGLLHFLSPGHYRLNS
ncbi:MAG TPA: DpnI domain-containing protein [Candidatus Dormibacteraeota bacterium]|nr:DpnI domain-containing protein [Candidatus Dormibacteraeota bacterium]